MWKVLLFDEGIFRAKMCFQVERKKPWNTLQRHFDTLVYNWLSPPFLSKTFPDKRILEKLTREGKSLVFYTIVNKAETLNKP
jgi:hypothetical protein